MTPVNPQTQLNSITKANPIAKVGRACVTYNPADCLQQCIICFVHPINFCSSRLFKTRYGSNIGHFLQKWALRWYHNGLCHRFIQKSYVFHTFCVNSHILGWSLQISCKFCWLIVWEKVKVIANCKRQIYVIGWLIIRDSVISDWLIVRGRA